MGHEVGSAFVPLGLLEDKVTHEPVGLEAESIALLQARFGLCRSQG
jgi:hypothetical protein